LSLLTLLRLCHVLGWIHGRLVDAVAITDAVTVMISLAALDLGSVTCMHLVAATSLAASLREPVNGQKNHGSGKKCAVFQ
jgi:hypothetical protein